MTGRRQPGTGRAILAMVALYSWLLQAFLAGMAPGPKPPGPGGICAPGAEHEAATRDPATPAGHDAHGCCLAACTASPLAARVATSERVDWPSRAAARLAWGAVVVVLPTGPPVSASRARGPPSA